MKDVEKSASALFLFMALCWGVLSAFPPAGCAFLLPGYNKMK